MKVPRLRCSWGETRRRRVGSLDELDQMAATVSGLDVTLVTVVQNFPRLRWWGPRAATIVNNHATRMVLAASG